MDKDVHCLGLACVRKEMEIPDDEAFLSNKLIKPIQVNLFKRFSYL